MDWIRGLLIFVGVILTIVLGTYAYDLVQAIRRRGWKGGWKEFAADRRWYKRYRSRYIKFDSIGREIDPVTRALNDRADQDREEGKGNIDDGRIDK